MALNISGLQIELFFFFFGTHTWDTGGSDASLITEKTMFGKTFRRSASSSVGQLASQLMMTLSIETSSQLMVTLSVETSCQTSSFLWSTKHSPVSHCIIGSTEALPILCVRYFRWERERERERDGSEWDGSDVTIAALKLAMNLHFPLPKIRTIGDEFTLSLAKNSHFSFLPSHFPSFSWPFTERSPLWRWNSLWVHTFHCQKNVHLFVPLFQMARVARRVIENPRQMIKSCPVLYCSSQWKNESN